MTSPENHSIFSDFSVEKAIIIPDRNLTYILVSLTSHLRECRMTKFLLAFK